MTVLASRTHSPARARRRLGFTNREYLLALAVFAAVTFVFFFPLVRGDTFGDIANREHQEYPWAAVAPGPGGVVVHYDQDDTFYPWQVFMSRSLRHGQFPLWDPYSFGGTPFFANGQSGVLYPPRLALSYVVSPARVHDLLLATHLLFAGIAMFLLLGFVGRSFPAALIGGLAWMLNSFALAWQALEHYVAVEVWLPIGVLLTHAVIRRRSWSAAFALALVLALLFTGGNVLFVELAITVILGYGVVLLVGERSAGSRALAHGVVRLATAAVLFIGMTLVSVLPTLDLTNESARVSLSYGELGRFAMSWRTLENIFKPPLEAYDPYHQSLFAGTAVGVLALIGLLRRDLLARFAAVSAILTILFMLHTPVTYAVIHLLPGFDNFKPLARAAFVLQFTMAILAAYGLDCVLDLRLAWQPRRLARWRVVSATVASAGIVVVAERFARIRFDSNVALLIALGICVATAAFAELADRLTGPHGTEELTRGRFLVGALIGGGIGSVLERFANPRFPSRAALVAAVVLAFAVGLLIEIRDVRKVGAVRAGTMRSVPRVVAVFVALTGLSIVVQARAWAHFAMPHQPAGARDLYPRTSLIRHLATHPGERFLPTGPTFRGSTSMLYSLHSAGGYESLVPGRIQNFWRVVGDGLSPSQLASEPLIYAYHPEFQLAKLQPKLLARSGVASVVAPPRAIDPSPVPRGLELRYAGVDGRVFSVKDAVPLAYVVRDCVVAPTPLAALERFATRGTSETVILETASLRAAGLSCPGGVRGRAGTASVTNRSLNTLTVRVHARRPGWLVVTESWDKGWTATVDGGAVEVLPADSALRAVHVAEGVHTVRFAYDPTSFRWGAVVSGVSVALTLAGLALAFVFGRRRFTAASATDMRPSTKADVRELG